MYKQKYLKYKLKYLNLKKQIGYGFGSSNSNSNADTNTDSDSNNIDTVELSKKIIIYDYDTKKQLYEIDKYDKDKLPHTFTSLTYFILTELKKDPTNDLIKIEDINLYKTIISGSQTYCDKGTNGKIYMDLPTIPGISSDKYCLQIKKEIPVKDQIPKIIKTGFNNTLSEGDMFDFSISGNIKQNEYGLSSGNGKMSYSVLISGIICKNNYEGDILNNREHGIGIRTIINMSSDTQRKLVENGSFINGNIVRGSIVFPDLRTVITTTQINNKTKKVISGKFIGTSLYGFGKMTFPNGTVCEGIFAKYLLYGSITEPDGTKIETTNGYFKDGKLNNYGKITFKDKVIYEGMFVDGKLEGKGKITEPNGYFEEGIFKDAILIKGEINKPNRYVLKGKFKNRKLNGKGEKFTVETNVREKGNFKNGILHGYGEIIKENEINVKGNFNMGQLNGKGEIIDLKKKIKKTGTFQNGLLHGQGELVTNGTSFVGKFYKDLIDGEIKITLPNGSIEIKYYNKGKLVDKNQQLNQSSSELNKSSSEQNNLTLLNPQTPIKTQQQTPIKTMPSDNLSLITTPSTQNNATIPSNQNNPSTPSASIAIPSTPVKKRKTQF